MRDFKGLTVWQKAHQLVLGVYRATTHYPKDEMYGLVSQTRRASASISANIAEGCGRRTNADFARFLQNAMGSASELEYHLLLGHDLGLLEAADYEALTTQTIEVKRMLTGLIQKLKADG
jgi:four helix bundle protein